MPRKSSADLEIVPLIPGEDKPGPPEDMSDPEKEVWRSTVEAMPLRWFGRETWPTLRALCKHQVTADVLGRELDAAIADLKTAKSENKRIERRATVATLQVMYGRETDHVRRCSADLRLTRHSRVRADASATAVRNQALKKPWDF